MTFEQPTGDEPNDLQNENAPQADSAETEAPAAAEPVAAVEESPPAPEAPVVAQAEVPAAPVAEVAPPAGPRGRGGRGDRGGAQKPRSNAPGTKLGGPPGGGRAPQAAQSEDAERNEWKEKVIQIRRVTKVVKGGKKLSFRAVVVVGDGKGQVGIGVGKSNEVIGAIQKAVAEAKKKLIQVPIHKTTIPHAVKTKAGGSVVVMLPASEGTGVIAGGAARALLELAGIGNILSKSLGSNSPLNVARATLKGLSELRTFSDIAASRGKTVKEILM